MSAVIRSPVDIVNNSLIRLGSEIRIGTLYDGSKAAKIALDAYGQTRDEEIRNGNWEFARGDVMLTLLKSAPADYTGVTWSTAYPPLPWKFEYAYPSDCLKVRSLRKTPSYIPDYDPEPIPFSTPNDPAVGSEPDIAPAKVIVCNISPAYCTYARQVTDPTLWDVGFVENMIAALARRFAPCLADLQVEQVEAADEAISRGKAVQNQG